MLSRHCRARRFTTRSSHRRRLRVNTAHTSHRAVRLHVLIVLACHLSPHNRVSLIPSSSVTATSSNTSTPAGASSRTVMRRCSTSIGTALEAYHFNLWGNRCWHESGRTIRHDVYWQLIWGTLICDFVFTPWVHSDSTCSTYCRSRFRTPKWKKETTALH